MMDELSKSGVEALKQMNKKFEEPTDLELALYWINEMRYPCSDPGNPEMNLGMKWYKTAKEVLIAMKEKPIAEQNPFAIQMLTDGILEFEIHNNLTNSSL